mmetsp:Transcript_2337/g.6569  ORF Transcript_2337/g.6569 Transcript_2337/m.6569 type:complete len:217 (-) Transcript_2337:35-685(-)
MRSSEMIGSLDPAYFEGRRKILAFLNSLLWLKLKKIEETASGAVACQLMSLIYPESIPLNQVHWNAKAGKNVDLIDCHKNYKLLQHAFDKMGLLHRINIDKLSQGVYKDNLEFCQYLHALYRHHGTAPPSLYNPAQMRAAHGHGGNKFNQQMGDQEAIAAAAAAAARALKEAQARKQAEEAKAAAAFNKTDETEPLDVLAPPPSDEKPTPCCWFCG